MPLTQLNHMECPHCGANLENTSAGLWVCPYCGAKFRDDSHIASASCAQPAPTAPTKPAESRSTYARILSESIARHTISPKAKHTVIGPDAIERDSYRYMRAKAILSIPEDALCYLLYSDSVYGFGKGFALCDTGVYLCPEYGPDALKPQHIPWNHFASISLHTQGNKLFFDQNGTYIYEETGADNLLSLLQKIMDHL